MYLVTKWIDIEWKIEFDFSHNPTWRIAFYPFQPAIQLPVNLTVRSFVSTTKHMDAKIILKSISFHGGTATSKERVLFNQGNIVARLSKQCRRG